MNRSKVVYEFADREAAEQAVRRLASEGVHEPDVRIFGQEKEDPTMAYSIGFGALVTVPFALMVGSIIGACNAYHATHWTDQVLPFLAYVLETVVALGISGAIVGAIYGGIEKASHSPDWVLRTYGVDLRHGRFALMVTGDAGTIARSHELLNQLHPLAERSLPPILSGELSNA